MAADTVSVVDLSSDPHPILHRLRGEAPVSWIPALEAWLVTSHEQGVRVLLDPDTFTVDDPRFSTQQVIGPSMLSLDGLEHRRHRDPFAGPFRAARVRQLRDFTHRTASRLVSEAVAKGSADLRSGVAGPLAVAVMARVLDLHAVQVGDILEWYEAIVDAVHAVTAGGEVPESGHHAFDRLKEAVAGNLDSSGLLKTVNETGDLGVDEIVSNVAVLLFGGIVTSESSIAIAFRYLIADPGVFERLVADRSLLHGFVEETFRLEPSAAGVDRYATRDVRFAGVDVARGDLVRVSLSAANRDPAVFEEPDRLLLDRPNPGRNVTFARGPHACLGIHLARMETTAAIQALLDLTRPYPEGDLDPVRGLVFRVPNTVRVIVPGPADSVE